MFPSLRCVVLYYPQLNFLANIRFSFVDELKKKKKILKVKLIFESGLFFIENKIARQQGHLGLVLCAMKRNILLNHPGPFTVTYCPTSLKLANTLIMSSGGKQIYLSPTLHISQATVRSSDCFIQTMAVVCCLFSATKAVWIRRAHQRSRGAAAVSLAGFS